jgi:serine/threonine protein kinase
LTSINIQFNLQFEIRDLKDFLEYIYSYLVMELCQGSMLDYCRKTFDESVASHVKATDVMWQITCGLDYLHRQKIQHGNLKLENVLFWKRDSKSKRLVVKLAGYGCKVLINYLCSKGTIPFTFNNCIGCQNRSLPTRLLVLLCCN